MRTPTRCRFLAHSDNNGFSYTYTSTSIHTGRCTLSSHAHSCSHLIDLFWFFFRFRLYFRTNNNRWERFAWRARAIYSYAVSITRKQFARTTNDRWMTRAPSITSSVFMSRAFILHRYFTGRMVSRLCPRVTKRCCCFFPCFYNIVFFELRVTFVTCKTVFMPPRPGDGEMTYVN